MGLDQQMRCLMWRSDHFLLSTSTDTSVVSLLPLMIRTKGRLASNRRLDYSLSHANGRRQTQSLHIRDRHCSRSASWVRRVHDKHGNNAGTKRHAYGRKYSLHVSGTRRQARLSCRVFQWVVEKRVSDEDGGWYDGMGDRTTA